MSATVLDLFSAARACAHCSKPLAGPARKKWCSENCAAAARYRAALKRPAPRECRTCGTAFSPLGRAGANRQHCSLECSRQSATASRRAFHATNPKYSRRYYDRPRKTPRPQLRTLERLWRKYPELPHACEGCGESRVLDVAHRPQHARQGAWRTMEVMEPHMIWVLCPTCHALLDRAGYSAAALGIPEERR